MNQTAPVGQGPEGTAMPAGLLSFLLDPRSYPHQPEGVRLIQTHASYVFVAPPFVFKVKKPVNFGFLDFSTLEKRRHFCAREVLLNRRLCPDLYLGVLPVWRQDGGFSFTGGDAVVEYAVQMRELPEHGFLDWLVHERRLRTADLDCIVAKLKHFYAAQHPTPEIEAWGRVDRLRLSTDENFRQTEPFLGSTLSRAAWSAIRLFTDEFYRLHRRLFEARIREQRIRDCHGDLHLEHLHLTPRALHIYDCIEFNDRFRYVDVASDAAFLAMDLDYEGCPGLARHFVTAMARELDDRGMPALMDFYKCYRAFVRGKVESLHSVAPGTTEAERRSGAERAARYFKLALGYAAAGSQPAMLAVMGRIATGKSALARALGDEFAWTVLSSDRLRKELAGLPAHERTPEAARERLYSAHMTAETYAKLLLRAATEIHAGRSVILDATFGKRALRTQLQEAAQRTGVPLRMIEARADDATVKRRLAGRESAHGEASDARLGDFEALSGRYEAPAAGEVPGLIALTTAGTLTDTLALALEALVKARLTHPNP